MVDEEDSKSFGGDIVWVRVPPPAPKALNQYLIQGFFEKISIIKLRLNDYKQKML